MFLFFSLGFLATPIDQEAILQEFLNFPYYFEVPHKTFSHILKVATTSTWLLLEG